MQAPHADEQPFKVSLPHSDCLHILFRAPLHPADSLHVENDAFPILIADKAGTSRIIGN